MSEQRFDLEEYLSKLKRFLIRNVPIHFYYFLVIPTYSSSRHTDRSGGIYGHEIKQMVIFIVARPLRVGRGDGFVKGRGELGSRGDTFGMNY